MQYGKIIDYGVHNGILTKGLGEANKFPFDENFYRYSGYNPSSPCYDSYFSQKTVDIISRQVTQNLLGLLPDNRPIKVTDNVIGNVMSSVYQDRMSKVADIYTIYTIPDSRPVDFNNDMIDRVINIITQNIRIEYEMIKNNENLTKWTTILGDFNKHNLRSHSEIKVRERNTSHRGMISWMNY